MYTSLAEASKIAYLYEDVIFSMLIWLFLIQEIRLS